MTSLGKILSGELLPTAPPVEDTEQDKFNRDVIAYLRRLMGKFTTVNLVEEALRREDLNGHMESITVKSYTLTEYVEFKLKLIRITCFLRTGVATYSFHIEVDGVTLTGTGDAPPYVSGTQYIFTFDSNIVTIGQRVEIVFTVVGGASADLAFTLLRERIIE